MSAIAGLWRFDGKPEVDAGCARMLSAQEVYGPHDGKQWSDGKLAMGRRLFRTLPEDVHDIQIVQTANGGLVLAADVRLDNRDELIPALRLPPERGRNLCDAALLLECLQAWGEGALDRLVGDFAFALWDVNARRLLLARDFIGQRPLHYHRGQGFFAFASMPKGLHVLPEIPYGPDEQTMAEFITLIPQAGPRSFFREINRVEAGHCVTVTRDGISSRRYWNPKPARAGGDYVEGLRHHLDQATRSRLRGVNGAAGAQLSSGFDSSSVTATAARLLAPEGGKVIAFTAVPREGYAGPFPSRRIGDEGPIAAATSAMYPNIEHVLVPTKPRLSPLDDIDLGFSPFERPMLNLCNRIWGRAIEKAARERGLNVLLTGQMGNMTVSYHGLEMLSGLLRSGRWTKLCREASRLVENRYMSWPGIFSKTFGPFIPAWLWRYLCVTYAGGSRDIRLYTAIHADCLAALNLPAVASQRHLNLSYRPSKNGFELRLWVMRRVDMGYYNKGTLASSGLDQRDPTADKRLVEYCLSVPDEAYLANGVPRALFRRAMSDRLPAVVLNERRKGSQSADWHETLTTARGEIAAELERLAACPAARKTLDIGRLQNLVHNWPQSGWAGGEVIQSYRHVLLRGISAGHFMRKAAGASQ